MITTEQLKELRDATGVSIMQCKKALEEAGGDMEKALMIMKKKSSDIAAKKADRDASEGLVVVKSAPGKAVMVTLNCETDFVAKNDDFVALVNTLADKALAEGVEKMSAEAPQMINELIQKIGENIRLGEVKEFSGSTIGSYVHNGKTGVVVVLDGGTETVAKDVAMHIAAMNPSYTSRADVPESATTMARELFQKEVDESGKPEDIKAKMLDGKLTTYFKEQSLLDQPFVKNPDQTVEKLIAGAGAKLVSWTRIAIGK